MKGCQNEISPDIRDAVRWSVDQPRAVEHSSRTGEPHWIPVEFNSRVRGHRLLAAVIELLKKERESGRAS